MFTSKISKIILPSKAGGVILVAEALAWLVQCFSEMQSPVYTHMDMHIWTRVAHMSRKECPVETCEADVYTGTVNGIELRNDWIL